MIRILMRSLAILLAALSFSASLANGQSAVSDSRAEGEQYKVADFLARLQKPNRAAAPGRQFFASGRSGSSFSPASFGPTLPVIGGGTLGRLTKWTGFTSTNSVIGDTTIFEDKYGKVGIGTDSPTSRLTVFGIIESSSGGFKFPDGTTQTTAAAPNALSVVSHDATLSGSGTGGSPLGVSVPLALTGSTFPDPIISGTNTAASGTGLGAHGGPTGAGIDSVGGSGIFAGVGIKATGGTGTQQGGTGLVAQGGSAEGQGKTTGDGIHALPGTSINGATFGRAGTFEGDVKISGNLDVTGNVSKGGGSFKIDHPLDPENKFLFHSFVESPDMMNIYNGNVTTDDSGEATIQLPDYFEALNTDFRYQLTVIGQFAQAIIASEIKGNRFSIRTSVPGVKVSWQVTGIRQDAWAKQNRIKVEVEKNDKERGHYLHPELFNQPAEKDIEWARNPQLMRRVTEMREQVKN